jgi:chitin synthase
LNVDGGDGEKGKSLATRYVEYQFDAVGRMVGGKYICFGLDRNWLTDEKSGSNFYIFYAFLEGLDASMKQELHLDERPDHYNYLANGKRYQAEEQDLTILEENLKSLGIGRRQQAQLFKLMAAILNLGNITFLDNKLANESCTVKNIAQLSITAELLGVDAGALESVLTFRTRLVRRDLISVYLGMGRFFISRCKECGQSKRCACEILVCHCMYLDRRTD